MTQEAERVWVRLSRPWMRWMTGWAGLARRWPSAAATRPSYSGSNPGASQCAASQCVFSYLEVAGTFVALSLLMKPVLHREFPGGLKVKLCGFVTNMAEWMTACDVIITKAGPGTIAEALICGLPIILNGFIPCQVCGRMTPFKRML